MLPETFQLFVLGERGRNAESLSLVGASGLCMYVYTEYGEGEASCREDEVKVMYMQPDDTGRCGLGGVVSGDN